MLMTLRTTCSLILVALVLCGGPRVEGLTPTPTQAVKLVKPVAPQIDFRPLGEALQDGAANHKVTAVVFTARWCAWCHQMARTTHVDPAVRELAGRFSWAKVDIDAQPHIAARFGVTGVPLLVLLNEQGEPLHSRTGYISPSAMVELLRKFADKADAPGIRRQRQTDVTQSVQKLSSAATPQEMSNAVMAAVATLSTAQRSGRAETKQHLLSVGARAWPGLVVCLGDERLAVRAAATDLLAESARTELGFDPFAPQSQRKKRIEAWQQWLQAQANAPDGGATVQESGE